MGSETKVENGKNKIVVHHRACAMKDDKGYSVFG